MTSEKRFLLAMSLSLMVVFIWTQITLQRKREQQKIEQAKQEIEQDKENKEENKNKNNEEHKNEDDGKENKNEDNNEENKNEDDNKENKNENDENNEQDNKNEKNNEEEHVEKIVVETDKYYMEWTNRGAALESLRLKSFIHSDADKKKKQKGKDDWLNIHPKFHRDNPSLIFSNYIEGNEKISKNSNLLWTVVDKTKENPRRLIFKMGPVDGMSYKKIFTFTDENVVEGKIIISNTSRGKKICHPSIGGASGINWECSENEISRFLTLHHLFRNNNNHAVSSYEYYDTAIGDEFSLEKNFSWAAITNKYFASVIEVKNPKLVSRITAKKFSLGFSYKEKLLQIKRDKGETPPVKELKELNMFTPIMNFHPLTLESGDTQEIEFSLRVGSKVGLGKDKKEFEVLEYYGWFDVVARLLLSVLTFFAGIFNNFAVAIICMTLCIKLILFPLTKKQQTSMKKYQEAMQVLQPQIKKIQQKYKNNRQRLNQETMALYKKNGVNPIPIGGCLPMFLQIPIFISLYNVLLYSIVLRQESFLWITDLAQPDHFLLYKLPLLGDYLNVLPIVMTALWILQQKLMPKTGTPEMQQQQKMFMVMTIFFGYLFYSLPAGLVMYWLTMNFFSICEQLVIRKFATK